ncbi:MAG: L-2-amino-thiazoline-4-carboxylic acid hydrolase [Desulfobacterales bacterium]|nr:L-2-amino-thiazoline-4-carboxylic acid hydrolase [Desulfobacterales bacterium]
MEADYGTDTLTQQLGVLVRRETEARILIPVARALNREYGPGAVEKIIGNTIREVAVEQGQALAQAMGGNDLAHFRQGLEFWTQGGALELDVREESPECLRFKVTRCKYAEMYRALAHSPEEAAFLGNFFSCNRDFALMEGFNPQVRLERPTTLMAGDGVCEFCYTLAP